MNHDKNLKILSDYFGRASTSKEFVKPAWNNILSFTSTVYQVMDSSTKEFTPRQVDSVITQAIDDLVSFFMSSVLSRNHKWASVSINEKLYELTNQSAEVYGLTNEIEIVNKKLEEITDITFLYLNQSNYYSEIARALWEAVNLGTGAFRVVEYSNPLMPFYFKYLPLDDLYYYEDYKGSPHYVFKVNREMNASSTRALFGPSCKLPNGVEENDTYKTFDLIESVMPDPAQPDDKYHYYVTTQKFGDVLLHKELDYNPLVVFRWSKEGNDIYGQGLSIRGLKLFRELQEMKEQRKLSALKLLEPPVAVMGEIIAQPY